VRDLCQQRHADRLGNDFVALNRHVALAAAAVAVVAVVSAFVTRRTEPDPVVTPPAPAPVTQPAPPAAVPLMPPPVRADGVVERSGVREALLSVNGGPVQRFLAGAPLIAGWNVASVGEDHVMLANGDRRVRLDVAGNAAAAAASSAGSRAPPQQQAQMPGFVAGGIPPPPPGVASDSNQRFREEAARLQGGRQK
jgi:hypothetical protein